MKKAVVAIILFVIFDALFLFATPLSNASANMAASFGYGGSGGNFIVQPKSVLEVNRANIVFEIGETKIINNKKYELPQILSVSATYQIVNSGDDAEFTFIFPTINPVRIGNNKYDFSVSSSGKEIPYKAENMYEIKNIFEDKPEYAKTEKLTSFNDRIYFDPLTGKKYRLEYKGMSPQKVFFVFNIFLKKGVANEVKVDFKSNAGFDNRRYQKQIYHYYYILDVKDFYKKFENVKISIAYPKNYLLKTNFTGDITEDSNKKILMIVPKGNFDNLSFSYMEGKISKAGILLYRHFPIFYSEGFWYLLAFVVFPILVFVGIIFIIYYLIKRRRRNEKS